MMDRFDEGTITVTKRADGTVMDVTPGPLRVSEKLVAEADPQLLSREGDVLTFNGVDAGGEPVAASYRIVGSGGVGPEGTWLLCEPVR